MYRNGIRQTPLASAVHFVVFDLKTHDTTAPGFEYPHTIVELLSRWSTLFSPNSVANANLFFRACAEMTKVAKGQKVGKKRATSVRRAMLRHNNLEG